MIKRSQEQNLPQSNLKNPACASQQNVLKLAILLYLWKWIHIFLFCVIDATKEDALLLNLGYLRGCYQQRCTTAFKFTISWGLAAEQIRISDTISRYNLGILPLDTIFGYNLRIWSLNNTASSDRTCRNNSYPLWLNEMTYSLRIA